MTGHRFAFDPPTWRLPEQDQDRTKALLIASAVWCLIFFWLGWRLLHSTEYLTDPLNLVLAVLAILLGVATALGWILRRPQFQGRQPVQRVGESWPALSVEEAHALTPSEFESYVADRLFRRHGFTVENTRDVKDGGVDILVTDPLGRQSVVQCKRYSNTVGSPVVRDLYGTMIDAGVTRAYLVTSGRISRDAYEWVGEKAISLVDGERLAEMAASEPALDVVRRQNSETA